MSSAAIWLALCDQWFPHTDCQCCGEHFYVLTLPLAWCQLHNKPFAETLSPGPWFYIKTPSYLHRKSHCGDKRVVRLSYLHNGNSYTGKMASLYWVRALGLNMGQVTKVCPSCYLVLLSNDSKTRVGLLSKFHVKFHVRNQGFSNMACDWLAAAASQSDARFENLC